MTLPVRLTPHVLASFEEEIAKAFSLISRRPELYQTVESTVRRASARKFPFSVFYRILPDWIEVIAVVHQSRDPRTWRRRV